MDTTEWVVIIVCGLLGYWIVSRLSDHYARTQENIRSNQNRRDDFGRNANTKDEFSAHDKPRNTKKALPPWYEILEVHPTSSLEEIKTAYRRKIQQYHPDRLEGMAPELRKLALEKSQEINAAYSEASRLKS